MDQFFELAVNVNLRGARKTRGLSDEGLPPVGLDCKGWLTFPLRFKGQFVNLRSKFIACDEERRSTRHGIM